MTLCPCDATTPPMLAPIAPGLTRLPRQIGDFAAFRADLLARIRTHPALTDWRARDAEDFGLMLLEFWAYISDVTAFYTSEHAQDLYLPTARGDTALRRLVALIDHVPRPAVAGEAYLAAMLDGQDPVTAAAKASFLSEGVDGGPPQVFETLAPAILDPLRNSWTVQAPRDTKYRRKNLLIDPATRNMSEEQLILIDGGSGKRRALYVKTLTPETALDGTSYLRLEVDRPNRLPFGSNKTVDDFRIWSFTQSAPLVSRNGRRIRLAGHYPQLRVGALVAVEDSGYEDPKRPEVRRVEEVTLTFGAPIVTGTAPNEVAVPGPAQTRVVLRAGTNIPSSRGVLHFGRVRAGRLAAPAKPTLSGNDLTGGHPVVGPVPAPNMPGSGALLVKGTGNAGLRVPGDVSVNGATGRATLQPAATFAGDATALRTPVQAHGNVLHVTRGKTVEEVLGDGQGPGVPFQSFTLTKAPLTYLHDETAPGGRRSSLQIWVDGIVWTEVPSLFQAGPDDRVFAVRLDGAGKATVTFGGEGFGKPAPLGIQNVFALYRYGAGDPLPAAQQIQQVAAPIKGLRRVFNVTPAFGGAPADHPDDIRFHAAATAATFDRAISANDFAALARDWGALAAVAVTEWVIEAQREGVVVTTVFDGTPATATIDQLQAHLTARAAEATPIRIVVAQAITGPLVLTYQPSPDANPATVKAALDARMMHPFTGLLSPRRAAIGGPVFRSAILGAAGSIPGIATILSLTWNGSAMPSRLGLSPHGYFAPTFTTQEVPA